jgi:membrane fusion protein, heavy metal efflux system
MRRFPIFPHVQGKVLPRWLLGIVAFVLLPLALSAATATADDGHNHGDTGPAVAGVRSPRFEAKSDIFELVGILDKGALRLFLDRYASNEPIPDATIDIEIGASKAAAARQADGTYLFEADILHHPGTLAFTFTVTAGTDVDLLAANLVIPEPHHDHPAGPGGLAALWPGIAVGVGLSAVTALIAIGAARLWRRRGVRA